MNRTHYDFHKMVGGEGCGDNSSQVAGTILVVDSGCLDYLGHLGDALAQCRLVHKLEAREACAFLWSNTVNLALVGHCQDSPCLELLEIIKSTCPSIPVVIIADQSTESLVVDVFRCGARDYFKKPFLPYELVLTLRALLGLQQTPAVLPGTAPPNCSEKVFRHIQTNFRTPLSLTQVAEQAGMSVSSFSRCFKKQTGMTFVDYVNSLRISNAIRLLKEARLSLLNVALSSGFSNQSHFNRVFRKHAGMTPGQYRTAKNRH